MNCEQKAKEYAAKVCHVPEFDLIPTEIRMAVLAITENCFRAGYFAGQSDLAGNILDPDKKREVGQ